MMIVVIICSDGNFLLLNLYLYRSALLHIGYDMNHNLYYKKDHTLQI